MCTGEREKTRRCAAVRGGTHRVGRSALGDRGGQVERLGVLEHVDGHPQHGAAVVVGAGGGVARGAEIAVPNDVHFVDAVLVDEGVECGEELVQERDHSLRHAIRQ